jgi:cation:H+ antiporter
MPAIRPLRMCTSLLLPAVILGCAGVHPSPPVALLVFGTAVVAASFLLAWAAEAAQRDISGGLAIALLALVAVLPEYAVDLYFAYAAGSDPGYVAYAAANMTGSNRLLLGLGWPLVVLTALYLARRRSGEPVRELVLGSGYRVQLGFLAIASMVAFLIPATGSIHLLHGLGLLGLFGCYLWRVARTPAGEPELIGTAATVGRMPRRQRRMLVTAMFVLAAIAILMAAEPFAHGLIDTGRQLGVDEFLLVQWLAPLASEAPEFIVAILFALHGKATHALGTLISSKVNQWTLLVGSLPVTYLLGGGGTSLVLNARQIEEFLLTATQTVLGSAVLLSLRFPRWAAWTLLALFALQFLFPGQEARYLLCALYAALAMCVLGHHSQYFRPTLDAPFRRSGSGPRRLLDSTAATQRDRTGC